MNMIKKDGFTSKERISYLCRMAGILWEDRAYVNMKSFLEMYSHARKDIKYISNFSLEYNLEYFCNLLYESMVSGCRISKTDLLCGAYGLLSSGIADDIMDQCMEEIEEFQVEGRIYHKILTELFFDKNISLNYVLESEMGYSHASFQKKKKEAILLFYVVFWNKIAILRENSGVKKCNSGSL